MESAERTEPLASLSLRVDRSFVTVTVPEVLGLEHLHQALEGAVPEATWCSPTRRTTR